MFPTHRPRRLRSHESLRRMVRENMVTTSDLIYPLFAVPGDAFSQEVKSMPGVYQLSVDKIVEEAKEVYGLGIPAVILFGIPTEKDTEATGAWHDHGIVQKATEAIKKAVPDLMVIVDTCLCEYTEPRPLRLLRSRRSLRPRAERSHPGAAEKNCCFSGQCWGRYHCAFGHDGWLCPGNSSRARRRRI